MDIRLLSALISAGVAIFSFIVLQFVIEPMKQKRRIREERYKNLYAPLYALIITRSRLAVTTFSQSSKRIFLAGEKDSILSRDYMQEMILKNMGYASFELIDAWNKYVGSFGGSIDQAITDEFVKVILRDYHTLRKQLGMTYNKFELDTGIPEVYKHLRNKNEDPV